MKRTQEFKAYKAKVKRINTRIATIAKKFGIDSQTYRNIIAPYANEKYETLTHTTSKGVLQINTNVASLEKKLHKKLTESANRSVPTMTRIRERVEKSVSAEFGVGIEKLTSEQVINLYEKKEETEHAIKTQVQFLYKYFDEEEQKQILPELYKENRGKRKLTYEELDTFYDRLKAEAIKENRLEEFEREVFT